MTKDKIVTVTLGIINDGESQNISKEIPSGPTEVPKLKEELGVAEEDSLWYVKKGEKKKQLTDHQTHNVKNGDHFEVIKKGGVS